MEEEGQSDLHRRLRKARIAAGMTQAALAARVGCTQSAVSMMESGRREAISRESLEKLAGILNVKLPDDMGDQAPAVAAGRDALSFCPNYDCPSNVPYLVGGEVYFMPRGNVGHGRHCVLCGELLATACPECSAPVSVAGGCCGDCGAPIVPFPSGLTADTRTWARARVAEIAEMDSVLG